MLLNMYSTADWSTAYYVDFSTLSDQDLASGSFDPGKTIDGKSWTIYNSGNCNSIGVGSSYSGLEITYNANQVGKLYIGEARQGVYLEAKLRQFFQDTNGKNRNDIEFRITTNFSYSGSFAGTYEGISYGIVSEASTLSFASGIWIHQGNWASAGSNFDRFHCELPGTLIAGNAQLTETSLGYIPNCARLTCGADFLKFGEYNDSSSGSIGNSTFTPSVWKQGTVAAVPRFNIYASDESTFFFGLSKYYNTGGILGLTLKELKIEWRYSPNRDLCVIS